MHIFWQSLRMSRSNLWGFGLGLALLSLSSVLFLPSIRESGAQLSQLLESMPKGLLAAFGVSDQMDLLSPAGFLQGRLFGFLVPLVLLIQGIGIGAATIAGEEERGQLEVVAAHPVSRVQLYLEKLGVLLVLLAGSSLLLFLSIWIGLWVVKFDIPLEHILAACFGVFLLALLFSGLALAIGAWTGRRGLATGVASILAVLAYFWNALFPLNKALAAYQKWSPFYQGVGYEPIKNGLDWGYVAILLVTTLVLLGVGLYRFTRRDLGV